MLEICLIDKLQYRNRLALMDLSRIKVALSDGAITVGHHLCLVPEDGHDHEAVHILHVWCQVVDGRQKVLQLLHLVAYDSLTSLKCLSRDTQ